MLDRSISLNKIGYSSKLQLPDSINVHPVFYTEKLRKAASNPLPGQVNEAPLSIIVDKQQEWEVLLFV